MDYKGIDIRECSHCGLFKLSEEFESNNPHCKTCAPLIKPKKTKKNPKPPKLPKKPKIEAVEGVTKKCNNCKSVKPVADFEGLSCIKCVEKRREYAKNLDKSKKNAYNQKANENAKTKDIETFRLKNRQRRMERTKKIKEKKIDEAVLRQFLSEICQLSGKTPNSYNEAIGIVKIDTYAELLSTVLYAATVNNKVNEFLKLIK
jgi:hypothetical protein